MRNGTKAAFCLFAGTVPLLSLSLNPNFFTTAEERRNINFIDIFIYTKKHIQRSLHDPTVNSEYILSVRRSFLLSQKKDQT